MNYFSGLCFTWAAVGLGSRALMAVLGRRWAGWETAAAYPPRRPAWLLPAGAAGAALVVLTWYMAADSGRGWAAAALLTLTLGKIAAFLFRYGDFRAFVVRAFREAALLRRVNAFVIGLSLVLALLGAFYMGR